jgi:glucosylceramidase
MKMFRIPFFAFLIFMLMACNTKHNELVVEVYETSASGNKLEKMNEATGLE